MERLSRKAYPECTHEVRDKIACSQFVAALTDGFVKRSLQVEGVSSLGLAIERAKTLKFINQNRFIEKKEGNSRNFRFERKETSPERKPQEMKEGKRGQGGKDEKGKKFFKGQRRNEERKTKECWKCGAIGHFRSECPTLQKSEN